MRSMVTLVCLCGHSWLAPNIEAKVKCPKCHGDMITKERERVEDAPLQ